MIPKNGIYTPVLKLRAGQQDALKSLSNQTKARVLPLMEVVLPKPKKKDDDRQKLLAKFNQTEIPKLQKTILDIWGERPAIIDFRRIGSAESEIRGLEAAFGEAYQQELYPRQPNLIVAINPNDPDSHLEAIGKIITKNSNATKACIRINSPPNYNRVSLNQKIKSALSKLGLNMRQVYVLLDLEGDTGVEAYKYAIDLGHSLSNVASCQGLIVASGEFPNTLSSFKPYEVSKMPRRGWLNWVNHGSDRAIFSDYTIRPPGDDYTAQFGKPSTNLRYTTENDYIIVRGKVNEDEKFPYLARALEMEQQFYGPDFSSGDLNMARRIADLKQYQARLTNETPKPGNHRQWIADTINHHITLAASQISDTNQEIKIETKLTHDTVRLSTKPETQRTNLESI